MSDEDAVIEEVDALPVLTGPGETAEAEPEPARSLHRRVPAEVVAQAAAVATAGFAAGAVTVAVARRRKGRRPAARRKPAKDAQTGIVATRRFLVDVHLLGPQPPAR